MTSTASLASPGDTGYPARQAPRGRSGDDGRSHSSSLEDATSHNAHQQQQRTRSQPGEAAATATGAMDALLAQLAELLAEALASRLAAEVTACSAPAAVEPPLRRLLTLDQLVAQLPPGKKPETWKRWLYERTRHNAVPGAEKIGGRWFFDTERTIPWLTGSQLDLTGEQSLHPQPMAATPTPTNRRGGA